MTRAVAERCWFNLYSLSQPACENPGRWRAPSGLVNEWNFALMRNARWCDAHKHDGDVEVLVALPVLEVDEEVGT